jgi:hypothetical protein
MEHRCRLPGRRGRPRAAGGEASGARAADGAYGPGRRRRGRGGADAAGADAAGADAAGADAAGADAAGADMAGTDTAGTDTALGCRRGGLLTEGSCRSNEICRGTSCLESWQARAKSRRLARLADPQRSPVQACDRVAMRAWRRPDMHVMPVSAHVASCGLLRAPHDGPDIAEGTRRYVFRRLSVQFYPYSLENCKRFSIAAILSVFMTISCHISNL